MKGSSEIRNKILLVASLHLPCICSLGPKCFLPQFDSSKWVACQALLKNAARSASKLSFPSFLHHLLKLELKATLSPKYILLPALTLQLLSQAQDGLPELICDDSSSPAERFAGKAVSLWIAPVASC